MNSRITLLLTLLIGGGLAAPSMASTQTPPTEGLRESPPGVHALTGARVVVAPGQVYERATLVIRDGLVEAVGPDVTVPADARVWELSGATIYPGFIEPASGAAMRTELSDAEADEVRGSVYWNPQLRAHVRAVGEVSREDERVAQIRAQGFTVANVVPQLGMFRGETAVMALGQGAVAERVLREGVAQSLVLRRDNEVSTDYPTSAMGAVAFVRQTLHDADWHERAQAAYASSPAGVRRPEWNEGLAALAPALRGERPLLVEVENDEEFLRALRFRDEFPLSLWLRGSGHEYRIADAVAAAGVPLLLPLALPARPSVERPEDALNLSLEALRHWHLAPENPARLAAAGVGFSFTAGSLREPGDFLPSLRAVVNAGLSREAALASLTTRPATLLGIERTHGTLERGKVANLVVVDGDLFEDGGSIRDVWVDGRRFEVSAPREVDPRGSWILSASDGPGLHGEIRLAGTAERLSGRFVAGERDVSLGSISYGAESRRVRLAIPGQELGLDGTVVLSGTVSGDAMYGWGESPDGARFNWRGTRSAPFVEAESSEAYVGSSSSSSAARLALPEIRPATEYGRTSLPAQPEHLVVRNATVWTMGPQGILEGADVLMRAGRVVEVGHDLRAPAGALEIDASGKHVTPGLVDAHLHAGVSGGVNETGSAIVPEVRVGDVVNASSVWFYRQLAGGLTTAHLMHGSANPIGGQNQHIKLRWGALPEDLKLEGAPRTVKFALGENVVRRNDRYPDTRMGTEQIIRDHFQAAREYERAWADWESSRRGIPPRRDLRMEALVDILNGDIRIQSHSYRQDEILMLMRLVEDFDTRITAFHHGVEAYKVAPELAQHGAGAVVWSDWSSFKIEAYDATTYNARILHDAGVVTSLHSDDSQVATRMNWEAAKMLRTGMSEIDALALITINTAKLLGVDDRVGSLETGKDADFVIWNGHPLSSSTVAEQTWIDGRRYYDIEEDLRLRREAERERALLLQLVHKDR